MPDTKAINKVIYGGRVLIDLTGDTVTADKLLAGYKAHGADGNIVNGTCDYDMNTQDANATAAEILSGKKAGVGGQMVTGAMKNNGAVEGTISSKDEEYTVPQGFHDGSGKVKIHAASSLDEMVPSTAPLFFKAHGADGNIVNGTCDYDMNTQDANATAAEILSGKKAGVGGQMVTGAMKNNGAVEGTISSKDEEYTVPQGFHDGSGKVKIHADEKAKLVANNIREGVTILGVAGSMTGTEGANPQAKTVTPSTSQQEILPDSESGYNYLSQVTVLAIPYSEAENPQGGTTVTIG